MNTSAGYFALDYEGADSHLHEAYVSGGAWRDWDITANTVGSSSLAPGAAIASSFNTVGGYYAVHYIDVSAQIHEAYVAGGAWADWNITAATQAPGAGFVIIGGKVANASGAGLAGVSVSLSGTNSSGTPVSLSTATNAAGSYSFSVPAGGVYTTMPFLSGYSFSPASTVFNGVSGNQTTNLTATVQTTATAQNCSDISGTWTDGLYTYVFNETMGVVTGTDTLLLLPYGSVVWTVSGQTTDGINFSMKVTNPNPTTTSQGTIPDTEDDFTLTAPTCSSVTATLTNRVYGPGASAGSSGNSLLGTGGSSSSSTTTTTLSRSTTNSAPQNTGNVTVIAWVDASQIILPVPSTASLPGRLGTTLTCVGYLNSWAAEPVGLAPNFLSGQADINYANAWLLQRSANGAPPSNLASLPSSQLYTDYRLFNSFSTGANGKPASAGQSLVGSTPDPCGSPVKAGAEVHQNNGYMANGSVVAQLAEGRLGTFGQAVNQTLNGHSTPWIWSVIQFDSLGNLVPPFDHAMFPTYYVYWKGLLVMKCPQSAPSAFISQGSSYQRLPSDIPAKAQPTAPPQGITTCTSY